MLLLAATPSASVVLVITRSVTLGVANGISVACGIVLGDLVFVALAILGMSILAESMGALFVVLRYIGGGYLIWLGFTLLRPKREIDLIKENSSKWSLSASFISGLLLTLGDIKAILFYASLFPAFVDMSNLSIIDIAGIVSITVMAVGGVKVFYAFAARRIAERFRNRQLQNLARSTAGCCMIGAGAYIVTKG
ncbi:LysE family translocator [bacterium]|nr:LysE family translocator [bacterium]